MEQSYTAILSTPKEPPVHLQSYLVAPLYMCVSPSSLSPSLISLLWARLMPTLTEAPDVCDEEQVQEQEESNIRRTEALDLGDEKLVQEQDESKTSEELRYQTFVMRNRYKNKKSQTSEELRYRTFVMMNWYKNKKSQKHQKNWGTGPLWWETGTRTRRVKHQKNWGTGPLWWWTGTRTKRVKNIRRTEAPDLCDDELVEGTWVLSLVLLGQDSDMQRVSYLPFSNADRHPDLLST